MYVVGFWVVRYLGLLDGDWVRKWRSVSYAGRLTIERDGEQAE